MTTRLATLTRVLVSLTFALLAGVCCAQDGGARRKVIIDQDAFGPASSNLQAILMLLQASDVEVLGITIPSGDGWRDEEVSHTLRLLEIASRTEVPVYPGAVYPLVNTQQRTKVWEQLYGKLFYKGAWTESWPAEGTMRRSPYHADPFLVPPSPAGEPKIKAAAETAAEFLVRKVHEFPGQITIIAAGPLTDLAIASRLDPQFASFARELVFMGGSYNPMAADNAFAAEYANAPRREFNMRLDPEAASIVLHEPWKKITQVPIDPTTRTFFKPEFFRQLRMAARHSTPTGAIRPTLSDVGRTGGGGVARSVDRDPQRHAAGGYRHQLHRGLRRYAELGVGAGPGLGERPVLVVQDVDVPRFEHMVLDLLSRPTPAH